jgi:hypothetical protein
MKRQILVLVSLLGAGLLFGCGDPSVNDVCGECSATFRDSCEQAYEFCKDTKGCDLDELEDAYDGTCGAFGLTEDTDAGL